MKVAIYTIALNEEGFVDRFMDSAQEADVVVVADTSSTDNTVSKLRARGAIVEIIKVDPWRFDVARNISMHLVPADVDVCVCIDLDEVLTPGWRAALEAAWTPETDRLRYKYVWNQVNGKDGITFWYDKIHTRHGFRWVKPVHEVLEFYGKKGEEPKPEVQTYCHDFTLRHFPDPTKSRSSYLPLLELGVREQPNDDRNSHYLGREYMYYNRPEDAIRELKRHLSLPTANWDAERAASMRYIARCYNALGNPSEAERWFIRATAEASATREPWVELGQFLYYRHDFLGAYSALKRALSIEEMPSSYINDPLAWHETPYDLAAICASQLGLYEDALKLGLKAAELAPHDKRIAENVPYYQKKVQSSS